MHFFKSMGAILPAVAVASAMPASAPEPVEKRHPVDFLAACEDHRPPEGNFGLLTATGVEVVWSGSNLGNQGSAQMAIIYDHDCHFIHEGRWEPQSPGFLAYWDTYDRNTGEQTGMIHARTSWIGAHTIPDPRMWEFDGTDYDTANEWQLATDCTGVQNKMRGINAGYWNACNFSPAGRL